MKIVKVKNVRLILANKIEIFGWSVGADADAHAVELLAPSSLFLPDVHHCRLLEPHSNVSFAHSRHSLPAPTRMFVDADLWIFWVGLDDGLG